MGSRTRRNRSRPIHPDVTTLVNKVAAAGDGVPASALVANKEFVKRCFVGGFWQSKMRNGAVFTMSANRLTGAIIPYGSFSVTNVNFVSTDYSLSTGLTPTGNLAAQKSLQFGINPSAFFSSDNSAQISFYSRTNQQTSGYPIAAGNDTSASSRFLMHLYSDPNTYFDCWNSSNDRVFTSFSNSLGLITGSRIANNDSRIYQNGTQVGSTKTTTITGARPTSGGFGIFGSTGGTEPRTSGYVYVGDGLTPSEEAIHYQAVQLMQMRLNRAV